MQSATGPGAQVASGRFSGGIFVVTQPSGGTVTVLVLSSRLRQVCRGEAPRAMRRQPPAKKKKKKKRAASHKVVNQVFGNAHGQFTTRGHYATAADQGTGWRTADRCDGTLIAVSAGQVTVTDRVRHRTFVLTRRAALPRRALRPTAGRRLHSRRRVRVTAPACTPSMTHRSARSGQRGQGAPVRRACRAAVPGAARRRRAPAHRRARRRGAARLTVGRSERADVALAWDARGLAPARGDRVRRRRMARRRRRALQQRHVRQRPAHRRAPPAGRRRRDPRRRHGDPVPQPAAAPAADRARLGGRDGRAAQRHPAAGARGALPPLRTGRSTWRPRPATSRSARSSTSASTRSRRTCARCTSCSAWRALPQNQKRAQLAERAITWGLVGVEH